MKILEYKKEWGYEIPYTGPPVNVRDEDIEALKLLRTEFKDREGDALSYKWDILPFMREKNLKGLRGSMMRLWRAGLILRFAKQEHTKSGRPEYIKWYIWSDNERQSVVEWRYSPTPHYISEG